MRPSVYVFVVALIISSACQKNEVWEENLQQDNAKSCFGTADIIGKADQYIGHVWFIEEEKRYAVVYYVPGSIDSQVYGIVCDLPKEFQQERKRVKFSGTYRAYNGPAKPVLGGQSFAYLELKAISAE